MDFSLYRKFKSKINTYKPYQYWYETGKEYQDEFEYSEFFKLQEKVFLNVLRELSFESVLEFGCGFGRMTKLILENFPVKKYVAFDLSPHQIQNAKKIVVLLMWIFMLVLFWILNTKKNLI
ncbi:MAG TPA: class I SAM-dependent methyltransferase [Nitrosopumilaceae archaeon]|nr:class I SAM-dependent methyltransferase [Nitrosopumilaceae archaeon]